jgi:hypothetical protein
MRVNLYALVQDMDNHREILAKALKDAGRKAEILGKAPILQAAVDNDVDGAPFVFEVWWPLTNNTWAYVDADGKIIYEDAITEASIYGDPGGTHN